MDSGRLVDRMHSFVLQACRAPNEFLVDRKHPPFASDPRTAEEFEMMKASGD